MLKAAWPYSLPVGVDPSTEQGSIGDESHSSFIDEFTGVLISMPVGKRVAECDVSFNDLEGATGIPAYPRVPPEDGKI
jgi:hypothetical protein